MCKLVICEGVNSSLCINYVDCEHMKPHDRISECNLACCDDNGFPVYQKCLTESQFRKKKLLKIQNL